MILTAENIAIPIGLTGSWSDNCIMRADGDQDNASLQGTLFYSDDSGNLGINEISPETIIEITSTVPYFTFHNSTEEDTDGGRESKLIFKGEQSGGEETTLAVIQVSHGGSSDDEKADIIFFNNRGSDGDSPTEAMRIDSNGYMGIGTNSPDSMLHVKGTNAQAGGLTFESSAGTTADRLAIYPLGNSGMGIKKLQSTANLAFYNSSGAEEMRLDNSGNLAIGVSNVGSFRLHVMGTNSNTACIGFERVSNDSYAPLIWFRKSRGTDISANDNDEVGKIQFAHYNDNSEWNTCAKIQGKVLDVTDTTENGQLEFYVQSAGQAIDDCLRMIIDNVGNVGINDVAPGEKLDIDGNANVTGVYKVDDVQVIGNQQAHIADADGTLADITAKFNTLLSYLDADAGHGLLAGA